MADWRANAPQSGVLWMRAKARPLFRRSIALRLRRAVRVPAEQETSFDYLAEASLYRPRGGDRLLLKRHSQSAAFETPADSLREGHWSGHGIDAGSKPVADLQVSGTGEPPRQLHSFPD